MSPARSLRWHLLVWLLPLAVVVLLVNTLAAYLIVLDASAESHDQGLADAAAVYIDDLRARPADIGGDMPPAAQRMLLATPEDKVFFALRSNTGVLLAGSEKLPADLPWGSSSAPAYFDLSFAGYWLRGISLVFEGGGRSLHLVLATTAQKREKLMRDILLGLMLPQVFLLLLTSALIWLGVRQGLEPLAALQQEIARRSHADLRPLDAAAAPEEMRPIVEETSRLLARLEQAMASQRNFVADAAHQLRTPVAALLAQAEAAEMAAGGAALAPLVATTRRLSRLVGQLLALSRAEGAPQERVEFDLAELIRDAADDWLPAAFRREIDVRFELAETRLAGSPHDLREAAANLVDNAVRHGRHDGHIVLRCFRDGKEAVLQVDDDGPGMAPDERPRVFERFHRAPGTVADGCGLGLPIVQGLVRRHGGTVTLGEAPELGGLRVEIRIPLAPT